MHVCGNMSSVFLACHSMTCDFFSCKSRSSLNISGVKVYIFRARCKWRNGESDMWEMKRGKDLPYFPGLPLWIVFTYSATVRSCPCSYPCLPLGLKKGMIKKSKKLQSSWRTWFLDLLASGSGSDCLCNSRNILWYVWTLGKYYININFILSYQIRLLCYNIILEISTIFKKLSTKSPM